MKIIVIGSKGFIGHHLVNCLQRKELEVWGADVVVDYANPQKYFLIDATNADFRPVFEKFDFNICINCSGAASVPDSLAKPLRDFDLNTSNVFKLLEAIRIYSPACKFINLSSAAVYGNPTRLPVSEDFEQKPLSPYGYHKMMSEKICEEYHRFFDLNTCSIRIFSAYGEGLKKQLFWDLYQKTKNGSIVSLFGSGRESRDFIYIKDLVEAIGVICNNAPFKGETINVANGEEVFIEECVRTFYSLFDNHIKYQFSGKTREGDPDNWVADIRKLKEMGYCRKYSLKEGLEKYYQWVRQND